MSEANAAGGGMRGGIHPLMALGLSRPGPYDRGDRFGMGMGMMGYGGRGRNLKGFFEDEYDDFGFGGGLGFGMRSRRGGLGSLRGGRGMGLGMMDRRGIQPGSCYISKTGHSVHMRGLPFQAVEQDVFDFFSPIQPVRCEFEFGENGRPTGEANVDFATHQEALEAMKKHRKNMQHRYIELFLNSEPNARGSLGGGGGYGNSLSGGFGGRNMDAGNGYNDDMDDPGFGQGGGFGGGYGSGCDEGSFGNGQGGFGGYGSGGGGFGNQGGLNSYDMDGGYGDGLGGGGAGRMLGNSYTSF